MTKKRPGRKRRKSKVSPNVTPNTSPDTHINKKQKQIESETLEEPSEHCPETLSETSETSDADNFLDAEDFPGTQFRNSQNNSQSTQDSKSSLIDNSDTTVNNSTMEPSLNNENIMDTVSQLQQSQSILQHQEPVSTVMPHFQSSTPIYQQYTMPQIPPVQQFSQMPYQQVGLSESDVLRVAAQVKLSLNDEIERLIKERVERETSYLKNIISTLQEDNQKLKTSFNTLEVQMTAKIDDLEQYSRRSCLRIVGIEESANENTNELVLGLANRLNIEVNPEDIEISHRVGPIRNVPYPGQNDGAAEALGERRPSRNGRPREIIVKFRNSQARISLLKGRAILRKKKEKTLFINEDLTKHRKSIAYECRQLKRENKIQNTWVYNGDIFIVEKDGMRVKINHTSELEKYKQLTSLKTTT